ncbi:YwpF family protein [Salibacterium halotolerans]|uniref:YwpF-like protein n=1 Tax=Salibacterium halotolerans TaxID=1884432 RepID=A0A1I5R3Y5_9BACI|nr:YwpF family protein [Salibacterium halotolerans]SFP53057.1 YwpF-like protein [Salibacterium halotolerans]
MKTFRLVSLFLLPAEKKGIASYRVPLQEGLIINREERDKSWLIEAVLPQSEEETFRRKMETQEQMVLEVIITDTHNDPALMTGLVRRIVPLEQRISVMFDAVMAAGKDDVSNLILEQLIEEGYSGHDMLSEFYERKQDQGKWSKEAAARIYKQLESAEN